METKSLGKAGENFAFKYLEGRGYCIIGQNIRIGRLELDAIATKGNKLFFFEIKSRRMLQDEKDYFPISQRQSLRLKRAALAYAGRSGWDAESIRFHLIEIIFSKKGVPPKIRHYRDIF